MLPGRFSRELARRETKVTRLRRPSRIGWAFLSNPVSVGAHRHDLAGEGFHLKVVRAGVEREYRLPPFFRLGGPIATLRQNWGLFLLRAIITRGSGLLRQLNCRASATSTDAWCQQTYGLDEASHQRTEFSDAGRARATTPFGEGGWWSPGQTAPLGSAAILRPENGTISAQPN